MPTASQPSTPNQAIGILDSGVGGLSILRAIRQELPHEAVIYVADQAHLPYGPRPLPEIQQYVRGITRFLLAQNVKLVVVACNAASAASLHYLREAFPAMLFVGMEPAVKPAAAATRTGIVGVLTTAATAQGELYAGVKARFAQDVTVETIVCPELVEAVEHNQAGLASLEPLLAQKLGPLLAAGMDQLALACTHFPFAAAAIKTFVGPAVTVIDPSPAIARQTRRLLALHNLLQSAPVPHAPLCYTTGDPVHFTSQTAHLIDEPIQTGGLKWSPDQTALTFA